MSASYTKLRDGNWGVRIVGPAPQQGATVTVTKKSGETKTETIGRLLWEGDDRATGRHVCLCSIIKTNTSNTSGANRRRGGRYVCEECGDYVEPGTRCWETGMMH